MKNIPIFTHNFLKNLEKSRVMDNGPVKTLDFTEFITIFVLKTDNLWIT